MTPSNDLVSVSTGALLHVSSTEALTTVTDFSEANSDSFFSRVKSLRVTLASGASSSFEVVAWARLADGSVAVFSPLSSPAFVLFANKTVTFGADTDVAELLALITGSDTGARALEGAAAEPLHRRLLIVSPTRHSIVGTLIGPSGNSGTSTTDTFTVT